MKKFDQWWMPDDEAHLTDHMRAVNNRVHGRLCYQHGKYLAAKPHIKDFRYAVDVGGHIGLWAFFLAHDFEGVMSFEPMDTHRECFRKNLEGFENVGLYDCALGAEQGHVALETRTAGSSGDTQVVPGATGEIRMETLDSFMLDHVDLLKIDCEGYEEFVLRGAVETLQRCKPCVIVEQKRDMSARYGLQKQSAVAYLESLGAVMRQEISGDFILSWD